MKLDSKEINEMMARCLAGECNQDELAGLLSILSDNPELKTEYELLNLVLGKARCSDTPSDNKNFDKIKGRLENEGLM